MTISGWGLIEYESEYDYTDATVLQTASSRGYSYEDCCNNWYPDFPNACSDPQTAQSWVGPDVLCAGNMTHKV